jgi:Xaa-Pro aminopeptidase
VMGMTRLCLPCAAHWLGLDVHDCGELKMDSLELQPGVVLTIEPGIYIPDEDRYGAYAGIGVRPAVGVR